MKINESFNDPNESDLHAQVANWRDSGVALSEIERRLSASRLPSDQIAEVVDAVLAKQVTVASKKQRRSDQWTTLAGIGLCVLGIALIAGGILGILEQQLALFTGGAGVLGSGVALIIRARI